MFSYVFLVNSFAYSDSFSAPAGIFPRKHHIECSLYQDSVQGTFHQSMFLCNKKLSRVSRAHCPAEETSCADKKNEDGSVKRFSAVPGKYLSGFWIHRFSSHHSSSHNTRH